MGEFIEPVDAPLMHAEPLDEAIQRRAALNLAWRLQRRPGDTSLEDVLTVLQALGLAPYEKVETVFNPSTGSTASELLRRERAARQREQRRLLREQQAQVS